MARWPKPAEGSRTEHFGLGTEPVSYEDSISPEFFELEREAVLRAPGSMSAGSSSSSGTGARSRRSWLSPRPRSSSCVTRRARSGLSTTCAATGGTISFGATTPRGRRAAWRASSSASTTAGATTSEARSSSSSRRRSSPQLRQGRIYVVIHQRQPIHDAVFVARHATVL
jgi:hypothetical protein